MLKTFTHLSSGFPRRPAETGPKPQSEMSVLPQGTGRPRRQKDLFLMSNFDEENKYTLTYLVFVETLLDLFCKSFQHFLQS